MREDEVSPYGLMGTSVDSWSQACRMPIVLGMKVPSYRPEDHLSRVELAKVLHISTKTLDRWRKTGEGPRWLRLPGGAIRYPWSDVLAWREEHREE